MFRRLYGEQARFFDDEITPALRHTEIGTVSMANSGPNTNASQFFITTAPDLEYLDGKHTIFGRVAEGLDVLAKINAAFVDEAHRPLKNIRIRHTILLDDPFPDPPGLNVRCVSPRPAAFALRADASLAASARVSGAAARQAGRRPPERR